MKIVCHVEHKCQGKNGQNGLMVTAYDPISESSFSLVYWDKLESEKSFNKFWLGSRVEDFHSTWSRIE